MNKSTLKALTITASLLFTSQISAQENDSNSTDDQTSILCLEWPKCAGVAGSGDSNSDSEEQKSQWSLLWEKLTQEMKEAVSSLPAPTQPE